MRGTASVLASALLALLLTRGAEAAPTACPEHFAGGQAPDIVSAPLARDTHALCFLGYANLTSGVSRTGLYSALRLTRERVRDARGDVRENAFHEEKRIPTRARARLADYTRSGYDRGHIAPNGDFPEPEQARESFSLVNIAPQVPEHNRGIWRLIEETVRRLASQRGELFVVTGVAFQPDDNGDIASLKGRVLVPSHYWKAVYDPFRRVAGAYYSRNAPEQEYEVISIAELRDRVGVDPFPAMPETAKQRAMPLPDPTERTATGRRSRNQG